MSAKIKRISIKTAFAILLALLMMVGTGAPALASAEAPLTVRVGVYESNGFIALNENEEMTGYGANFMTTLAEYANIRYEYVHLTWSGCMSGLLDGSIDIVTDARKTAERDELYDFSIQCIGQIQGAVFVPKDMADIYFNDYNELGKLVVGFEEDALNKTPRRTTHSSCCSCAL